MRILHTANTYAPLLDGVSEVVRHISEELARRGHEVHVATRAVPSQPAEEIVNRVHVHRFSVSGNLTAGMRGKVREYQEFVRAGPWDVMVNHCLQVWPTDALLEDIAGFPWASILVTHGLTTGNPIFREYYGKMPLFIPRYAAWVSVSALSEEFAFASQHGLRAPTVIRNGVDLREWSHSLLNLREMWNLQGNPWLINVSNHNPLKRHDWSFQLAGRLKGTNAKLTIVGNYHPADKWQLGRLGIRGGCFYECRMRAFASRSVRLKTAIARREVVSAIREADLLVSTSRWETNSVVLLESMAAGTAWVSTDVGSARENTGGIVVNSVNEMAEAVLELLRDADRRRALGREGRARIEERHDWNRIVNRYERIYENAIAQPIVNCGKF
jgi:glycosyltransferase involved in cell wall biosynthesis